MLFLEFHGTEAGVAEQSERFGEIAAEFGGGPFEWTTRPEERTRLWEARHDAAFVDLHAAAGRQHDPDRRLRADLAARRMRHRNPARHRREQADRADRRPCRRRQFPSDAAGRHATIPTRSRVAKAFNERLIERALAMDGTCTGEHGVGQGKMKYLLAEHGAPALDAMRAIKRALDPHDIMNPGKICRFELTCSEALQHLARSKLGGHRFAAKPTPVGERRRRPGSGRACPHI